MPQLRQDVLPLLQLLPDFLLMPRVPLVVRRVRLLHSILAEGHRHLRAGHGILQHQLLDSTLVLLASLLVLSAAIHGRILRPRHRVGLLREPWLPGVSCLRTSSSLIAISRRLSLRACRRRCLILADLALQLHRVRKTCILRPLHALCVLLMDLPQIDVLVLVLLCFAALQRWSEAVFLNWLDDLVLKLVVCGIAPRVIPRRLPIAIRLPWPFPASFGCLLSVFLRITGTAIVRGSLHGVICKFYINNIQSKLFEIHGLLHQQYILN